MSEKIYRVQMNKHGMPNFATAEEVADRPQGEWKHLGGDEWLCSECGYVIWTEGSWEHPLERGKDYCEHCGARMKGADDE